MKKYLAILTLPFLVSCGGETKTLADKVLTSNPPAVERKLPSSYPCYAGLHHLLDFYKDLEKRVEKSGLVESSVKRMYDLGKQKYGAARKLQEKCEKEDYISGAIYHMAAIQVVLAANDFMIEALQRQKEITPSKSKP